MWGKISLKPELIFTAVSPISGKINVWQSGAKRILEVGGFAQSLDKESGRSVKTVWGRTVGELAARSSDIKSALILGLGGGTEAHLLVERYPDILIDAVEFDPAMVEIGRRFFDLGEVANLQVIIANALDVVKNPKDYPLRSDEYPVIIADTYVGGNCSPALGTGEVLSKIKSFLADDGVAIFNRMSRLNPQDFRVELEGVFDNIEEVVVPSGWGLPPGNILFFCSLASGKPLGFRARNPKG